jgi:hypothetical protein
MQRVAWTDERLDDLARRMDAGFERADRSFDRVDRDIRDLRLELGEEIGSLRTTLMRFGTGIIVGLVGVIATVVVNSPS